MSHPLSQPLAHVSSAAPFVARHIGPRDDEIAKMLDVVGYDSLDALVDAAVPESIRSLDALDLPEPASEIEALEELRAISRRNQRHTQMIGLGYYDTVTPPVVVRRVIESPAWYTAYTPYQPEISQGRLEALINFQTVVSDLTGLPTANSSLLDESTAAAEAMTLMRRSVRGGADRIIVDADCLPQTIAVVQTRAEPLGLTVEVTDLDGGLPDGEFFGVLVQYPGASGRIRDLSTVIEAAHERGALVGVCADLLALTLLVPPGELGADVVVGTSQRFGVPLGYG
ncbi:MAG: glycine dehydrogenase (aminomethyl-transferring), partial [Jiangellaceae bacterium]